MNYTIVGVIGHIDHGKTSLVAALTGVDTDTHPEEKRRGITIDLGFASFTKDEHQFAMIDAPGHQRYIGNLLAGVAGIDIGLLVVACDQGIQEQTLEHASILQLLGVHRLIVALSRTDLATDDSRIELQEELELYLEDLGFTGVPMIPVSCVQKTGLDDLRAEMCRMAGGIEARPVGRHFRLPVDRVFSMPGRGCVVAGTVWSGRVHPEDNLQMADSGTMVRVREIEVHDKPVESSSTGYRTALNVTGVSAKDIRRGDELIEPGVFHKASRLLVEIQTLKSSPEIKCPATLQLHLATSACAARVIGVRRLLRGRPAVAVVETEHPVIATFGQRCLFRLPYPLGTIGGGRVLAAMDDASGRTRRLVELGERLAALDPSGRLAAWIDFLGEADPKPDWCELQVGIPQDADLSEMISDLVSSGFVLKGSDSSRLFSATAVDRITSHVKEILTKHAVESQNAWRADESIVEQLRGFGSAELIRWVLQSLIDRGIIVRLNNMLAVASDENRLSGKQKARMNQIVKFYEGNRTPPTIDGVATELNLPLESVVSLCRFAVQSGMLTDADHGFFLETSVFRSFCDALHDAFVVKPQMSVAEIRDCWHVTRKHAVPFLEYCDKMKITIRRENDRTAGPALRQFLSASRASPELSSRVGES